MRLLLDINCRKASLLLADKSLYLTLFILSSERVLFKTCWPMLCSRVIFWPSILVASKARVVSLFLSPTKNTAEGSSSQVASGKGGWSSGSIHTCQAWEMLSVSYSQWGTVNAMWSISRYPYRWAPWEHTGLMSERWVQRLWWVLEVC